MEALGAIVAVGTPDVWRGVPVVSSLVEPEALGPLLWAEIAAAQSPGVLQRWAEQLLRSPSFEAGRKNLALSQGRAAAVGVVHVTPATAAPESWVYVVVLRSRSGWARLHLQRRYVDSAGWAVWLKYGSFALDAAEPDWAWIRTGHPTRVAHVHRRGERADDAAAAVRTERDGTPTR